MDDVWYLQDFKTGAQHVFSAEHLAMHNAERIVGNRAFSEVGKCLLYGPGDGTTQVKIERITRDMAFKLGLDPLPE